MKAFKREVEKYLNEDEAIDFLVWAFGTNVNIDNSVTTLIANWNIRHGLDLRLHNDGKISDDVPEMIEIWRKENGL